MKKIEVYRSDRGGHLEESPIRALAWELHYYSVIKNPSLDVNYTLNFSQALWILENKELVKNQIKILEELETL